jgi:S1-C subfamily serine protease
MIIRIMKIVFVLMFCQIGTAMGDEAKLIQLSRESGVKIISQAGNSSGSGFFIGDQYVVTCFHVVAKISSVPDGKGNNTVNWTIFSDLRVLLPSGETINGTVITLPTQADPSPLFGDFAIIKLGNKPTKSFSKLTLGAVGEKQEVGDTVVFSGYPLATPGMVTHRGMISGSDSAGDVIFIQAAINKGNSGGALLNADGHAIGVVSNREGGISQGLSELSAYIDRTSSQGSVQILGVDPLQSTKAIVQTLDQYISTGIGYARSIRFAREYIEKNPKLLD